MTVLALVEGIPTASIGCGWAFLGAAFACSCLHHETPGGSHGKLAAVANVLASRAFLLWVTPGFLLFCHAGWVPAIWWAYPATGLGYAGVALLEAGITPRVTFRRVPTDLPHSRRGWALELLLALAYGAATLPAFWLFSDLSWETAAIAVGGAVAGVVVGGIGVTLWTPRARGRSGLDPRVVFQFLVGVGVGIGLNMALG